MSNNRREESVFLTDKKYWDNYWRNITLPMEIKYNRADPFINEILKIYKRHLPVNPEFSLLEIGGAPGQYLAFFNKTFQYQISLLDFSEIGLKKAEENLRILNIPCTFYEINIMSDSLNSLPLFDIVFSQGFLEHFRDPGVVLKKHLELLKPGGLLLLGIPNLRGIYSFFLKILAPEMLKKHNLAVMDRNTWSVLEAEEGLRSVFKGYIGGFEPKIMDRIEKKTLVTRFFRIIVKILIAIFSRHFPGLRRFNSKIFSGYFIGIYNKSAVDSKKCTKKTEHE